MNPIQIKYSYSVVLKNAVKIQLLLVIIGAVIIQSCGARVVGSLYQYIPQINHVKYYSAYTYAVKWLENAEMYNFSDPNNPIKITNIIVSGEEITFNEPISKIGIEGDMHSIRFADFDNYIAPIMKDFSLEYGAIRSNFDGLQNKFTMVLGVKYDNGESFLDAVAELLYQASDAIIIDDETSFTRFKRDLQDRIEEKNKPEWPAEIHRLEVLAKDAIEQKKFFDAIDYFEEGLDITPFWSDGHFNLAIIYSELKVYGQAVVHMKRYLQLNSNSEDAIKAQEHIFLWTEKAKKLGIPSSVSTYENVRTGK